jgi:hypothetical protein
VFGPPIDNHHQHHRKRERERERSHAHKKSIKQRLNDYA